jgi:hypothetical protein
MRYKIRNSTRLISIIPIILWSCGFLLEVFIVIRIIGELMNNPFFNISNAFTSALLILPGLFLILYLPYAIIYIIVNTLFGEIVINDNGIIIKNPDTNLFIEWNNISHREEETILGIQKRQYLILTKKTQLINRGLNTLFFFWYKTNKIVYSQYEDKAIEVINTKIPINE